MLTFKFQILLKHLQVCQEGNSHPHPYFGGLKLCQVVVIQDALNRLIHQKGVTMKLLRTSPSLSLSINVRVLSTYHNFLPLYLRKVTLVTLISLISFWLRLHGRRIDTLYLRFRQRVVYGYHLTAIVSPQQTTKSRHRKRWWRKF